MAFFVLFLIFIIGSLILKNIGSRFSTLEYIGAAFPLGLGAWSVLLMVGDLCRLPIGNKYLGIGLLSGTLVLLLTRLILLKKVNFNLIEVGRNQWINMTAKIQSFLKNPLAINPAYFVMMGITTYISVMIIGKCLYWPVSSYDAVDGFSFLAKIIKEEHTINSSIFSADNPAYSVRSFYPPLLVHALSITYIYEMANSKIISAIFIFSTLVSLYAYIRKENSYGIAAFGISVLSVTPEYMSFTALVSSNTVAAYYVLLGLASFDLWYRKSDNQYFLLSILGLSFAIWTRTETIIFAFVVGLGLLTKTWFTKDIKRTLVFGILTLLPFIFWQIYLKNVIAIANAQPIITHFYWDGIKFTNMINQMQFVVTRQTYYGFTLITFAIIFGLNILFFFKDRRVLPLSIQLVSIALLFIVVYFQIDTDYASYSSGGWIGSGFKRGVFYFIPIGCYYIANSFIPRKIFH